MKPHLCNNKVIWIIGASTGIGRCMAAQLLQHGARLVVSSRNAQSFVEYQDHPRVRVVELDLAMPFDEAQVFSSAVGQYGVIDSVVYCAGVSQRSPDAVLQYRVAQKLLSVNCMSFVQLCGVIVPYLIVKMQGQIIGLGSLAGSVASPGRSIYSMAKSALHSYLETLHIELKPYNISVQHYQIGFVHTTISQSALTADGTTYNNMDAPQAGGMSADRCAKKIIHAMNRRNRFNTSVALQAAGRLAIALRALCPRLLYAQLAKSMSDEQH